MVSYRRRVLFFFLTGGPVIAIYIWLNSFCTFIIFATNLEFYVYGHCQCTQVGNASARGGFVIFS